MRWIRQAVDRFWCTPVPAARLGWIRVISGGFMMFVLLRGRRSFIRVANSAPDHFRPVGLASYLEAPISPQVYEGLLWATIVLGTAFVLGFWHRFVGPLFAGLLLWVISYRLSWGMIYRVHHLVSLHILILGLVPAASAVSIDAWIMRRHPGRRMLRLGIWPDTPSGPHWRFGWPVQLMCVVTAIVYSLAGLAKVMGPAGWAWGLGNNLRNNVAHDALAKELMTPGGASEWVQLAFASPELMAAAGVLSLVIELCAPLFLFHRRLAQVWVVLALCMHFWIRVLMDLTFTYQTFGFAFASFFAVEAWAMWVGSKGRAMVGMK